jgi:predicted N-acetyltransferase YhbS
MKIKVREAIDCDIDGIIALFSEEKINSYSWNAEKWRHYYREYPEGFAISLVATIDEKIVGHYGLQSVKISGIPALLGLHAYVSAAQRGLLVISALMRQVDEIAKLKGVKIICGFANPNFSRVKSALFKWKTIAWMGFQKGVSEEYYKIRSTKKLYFQYSNDWYFWRFGSLKEAYVSFYIDQNHSVRIQLLKQRLSVQKIQDAGIEVWSPEYTFGEIQNDFFTQPFSIKVIDPEIIEFGVLDYQNWCIDMGDSDTFQYTPVES